MEVRKTITHIFMMPTLGIGEEQREEMKFDKRVNYLNSYSYNELRDVDYPENAIFLLYKPKDFDKFREFLDKEYERENTELIEDYDHEGGFVVAVYLLNNNYKNDFDLIREGKYSKTSTEFQKLFKKMVAIKSQGPRDNISLHYRIFNKTEDLVKKLEDDYDIIVDRDVCLKDQEVWRGFIKEKETLTVNTLKQYV
jgi:hypothetical protein